MHLSIASMSSNVAVLTTKGSLSNLFDNLITVFDEDGLVRELNDAAWLFDGEAEEEEDEIFWKPFGLLAKDDIVE